MVLRRIFLSRCCVTSNAVAGVSACGAVGTSSSSSSCCAPSLPSSPSSSVMCSSSASSSSAVLSQQRRYAQTLKDIEKHGAKGTSKLLKDLFPEVAMEVDRSSASALLPSNVVNTPATSGTVDLDTILFDSGRRVQWRCKQCAYSWVASVMSRTILKKNCPACHKRENPLLSDVDPRLLQELHPTKNTIFVEPETLEATDRQRLWWLCGSCNNSFQGRVLDRVQGKAPCPECDRGQFSDFKVHKLLLEEFHPTKNGDLTLAKLRPTDKVQVWWLCHSCGHEFICPLSIRVNSAGKKAARYHNTSNYGGCPKCAARVTGSRGRMDGGGGSGDDDGGATKPKATRGRKKKADADMDGEEGSEGQQRRGKRGGGDKNELHIEGFNVDV